MAVVSGGTTLIDNGALDSGVPTGSLILLSTQTASSSASISFTSGIDSTYDSYVFKFINMHPSAINGRFEFNLSTDGGSNYNVTKTSTFFRAYHNEAGDSSALTYETSKDLAQSTSFQRLSDTIGNDNDQSCSGILHLFNPSSTTFVKHFIARTNTYQDSDFSIDSYISGYGNTTSSIDAIQFKMDSGNIDSGQILLFGVN